MREGLSQKNVLIINGYRDSTKISNYHWMELKSDLCYINLKSHS